ncbi:MAG TPA: NAD(P)/FAD-dependent oxidoreductase [Candidatus Ozemobacteraceae bacterium]|nr:NAD(P)/FAD-dependent oxidoreductase [Candidatus Ozemobacteraceae bacterium]
MLQDGEKGVIIQRDQKTYAVAPHIPCGVVSPATLRKIADVAEKFNVPAIKLTSAERIALVGIREEDVDGIWEDLGGMKPGAAVGLCIRSVKTCPGTTFCKRGIQDSLSLGMKLDELYHGLQLPGKFKIGVSGCPNQCAETCIKDLGFIGLHNGWRVMVGGNGGAIPRLSKELIKDIDTETALIVAAKVINWFKANGRPHQRLGMILEKTDIETFRRNVIG